MKTFIVKICAAVALALLLSGCGSGGPRVYPASGTVKYKGTPVAGANVTCLYEDGNSATGVTNDQGKFTLTYGTKSGAPAGKTMVGITKIKLSSNATMMSSMKPDEVKDPAAQKQKMEELKKKMGTSGMMNPPATGPAHELPAKYANPKTSGLTWEIKSGTNDEEFVLVD